MREGDEGGWRRGERGGAGGRGGAGAGVGGMVCVVLEMPGLCCLLCLTQWYMCKKHMVSTFSCRSPQSSKRAYWASKCAVGRQAATVCVAAGVCTVNEPLDDYMGYVGFSATWPHKAP